MSIDSSFTRKEIERARRYHRPLYQALALDLALGLGVLTALAVWADWRIGPWWVAAPLLAAIAVSLSALARLPLGLWRHAHERRWGFSTQGLGGWLADRAKALAIGCVLSALPVLGLVGLAHAFPRWWPAVAAPGAALLVVLLGFVAPVLLEPVFNRFTPLADRELADELRALAARAGVPVRDVLVCDASRRTRKVNAYVSGIGRTRRVVLFDTLLESAGARELKLVVAHELGHRRARHVAKGTALGMLGAAVLTLVLWTVLEEPRDPTIAPLVLLAAALLELVSLPFRTWLSRRWERAADRFSLELTRDPAAFEAAHRELAIANLSDLDPPRWLYALLHTHPTAPERIADARVLSP